MIDGTPLAPVLIDMKVREIVYPNGQTAGFKRIAIPRPIREKRSRQAYALWHRTRENNFPMPIDCGLAERNSVYLYSTTSLSLSQCERLGVLFAAYLTEVLI